MIRKSWLGFGLLGLFACGCVDDDDHSDSVAGASGGAFEGGGAAGRGGGQAGGNGGTQAWSGAGGDAGGAGSADADSSGGARASGGFPGQAGAAGTGAGASCPGAYSPPLSGQLQSISTDRVEASECSGAATFELEDQCGCEGRTCGDGEMCILVYEPPPSALGGPGFTYNGCFEPCESDADCEVPDVCVTNLYGLEVCATVECRSDADCDAGPCGTCVLGYLIGHGGVAFRDPSASYCAYAGPCSDDACAEECFTLSNGLGEYHQCYSQ